MSVYETSFFTQIFKEGIPGGTDPIDRMVEFSGDPKSLAGGMRGVNLRMIAGQRRGEEGKYAMSLYMRQRGDPKFRSGDDLFATPTFAGDLDVLKSKNLRHACALEPRFTDAKPTTDFV